MSDEQAFLNAIRADTENDVARLVYADWLQERDDPRHQFVRGHLNVRKLSADHIHRPQAEKELSQFRKNQSVEWLAIIEPERAHLFESEGEYRRTCSCFDPSYDNQKKWFPLKLHTQAQDTECDAWKRLCDHIEEAAHDGREEFEALKPIPYEQWRMIVTLPQTIAKLKAVRVLHLYGSRLMRIPPEISEMENLVEFDPYTSYSLHWYPYEIASCPNLRESRMSTRALYGNYKYHPPFPALEPDRPEEHLFLNSLMQPVIRRCSVCRKEFDDQQLYRVWITLRLATDDMPFLVNACSRECIKQLPATPKDRGYPSYPHRGGLGTPRKF